MPTDVTTQIMPGKVVGTAQKNVVIAPNKAVNRQEVSENEQNLPSAKDSSLPPEEKLNSAAADMNQYVQNMQRDLHFSVDEESGETIIKVVESGTKRLVRTIPSEEFLHASQDFNQTLGVLLNAKA